MYYLFVAVDLPEAIRERLQLLCSGLPGVNWLEPSQFHLTVRYIGGVDGAQFEDIQAALETIRLDPIEIHLTGIGFFPPRRRPEKIWVGVSDSEHLTRLHRRIDTALVKCGLEPEGRKFTPHVTIGHFGAGPVASDKPRHLADYLGANSLFSTESFTIRHFCLYSGARSSQGPLYREEAKYDLTTLGVNIDEELS